LPPGSQIGPSDQTFSPSSSAAQSRRSSRLSTTSVYPRSVRDCWLSSIWALIDPAAIVDRSWAHKGSSTFIKASPARRSIQVSCLLHGAFQPRFDYTGKTNDGANPRRAVLGVMASDWVDGNDAAASPTSESQSSEQRTAEADWNMSKGPPGSPSASRRRPSTKAPDTMKRASSSPNVRAMVTADVLPTSLAEKRRNKLGYHRTTVACGQWRPS